MPPIGAADVLGAALALASGFGAYAAIRADLARLHERTTNALESAKAAHQRIDQHFDQRRDAP